MEGIERESFALFCPGLADVFVWGEAFEGLEALCEVVSCNEVGEMAPKLVVGFVVEALDGCLFDGPAHAFDLSVRPGMLGLGETMIDIVLRTGQFEGMGAEEFLPLDHCLYLGDAPASAAGIGKVDAIVGENNVDLIGDGLDQGSQKVCSHARRDRK